MAQQYVTDSGVLIIPGAYTQVSVQNQPSGLSTTGVIAVIGEADQGPAYSEEDDLSLNLFGPDQVSELVAKYKSGPLIDAFRGAVAASNDTGITGSFSRFMPVKTNTSVVSSGTLTKVGSGTWANIVAKSAGKLGNMITKSVTSKTAEVVPSVTCNIAVPQRATDVSVRADGGAAEVLTLTQYQLPSAMVTTLNAGTTISCTGGTDRAVISSTRGGDAATLNFQVVSGNVVTLTISTTWEVTPTVGDLMYLPAGSIFATANEGSYIITAVTSSVITATKLLDAVDTGSAGHSLTAPTSESGAIDISATGVADLRCFAPLVISYESATIKPGCGKSLEIANSGTYTLSATTFDTDGDAVDWVSTTSVPTNIVSSAEQQVQLNTARQTDSIEEELSGGGPVYLTLGYKGTTASAVIASGVMTITVTGGSGTSPAAITLADYPTINDLVTYLSTLTGFSAAPGTNALGQASPTNLDPGTYTLGSDFGAKNGRIKMDGYLFSTAVNDGSVLVDVEETSSVAPFIGLPAVAATTAFLTGGSKGATLAADITGALTALEATRVNFIVPAFSRDATDDIADSLTDAASTYEISAINTAVKSHCLQMSQLKRRRNRQAFLSIRGTFVEAQDEAGSLAQSRCALFFQDVKDVNSAGSIYQFQPWMAAVKAAGMQAAGFYRPIVNKFVNVSSALQAAADFNDQRDSHLENALLAGLCPITRAQNGGFRWVSDQTTYTKDDNFVFNSIQAVYMADTMALSVAERMEQTFVGQSVADVSASLAKMVLESILDDFRRLKILSPSDDAPRGFKNTTIRITGPSMVVGFEAKLAGAIYFIPIYALVTPVTQSA